MSDRQNAIPGSDWASPGTWYGRLGAIHAYREEPLQAPYILWDLRTFDGEADRLENLGTSGAVFDLNTSWYSDDPDFPKESIEFHKSKNWDNSYGTTPNPAGGFPTSWADWGGDPCDGAFTCMVALGPKFYPRTLQFDDTITDPFGVGIIDYLYFEIDVLAGYETAEGGGIPLNMNFLGDNDGSDDGLTSDFFWEWYDDENYCQWLSGAWERDSSGEFTETLHEPFANKLMTVTVDPWKGEMWVWVDEHLVQYTDLWGDGNPSGGDDNFVDFYGNCINYKDKALPADFVGELFLHFSDHQGPYDLYIPNAAWPHVIGAAFFRGHPTTADRAEWRSYFYDGDTAIQPVFQREVIDRADLSNTDPHSESWVVPNNGLDPANGKYPINEVMIFLIPSGGGNGGSYGSGFLQRPATILVPVSAGDTFTFDLGGGGASGPDGGVGGWPNGGDGGLNTTNGLYGYGGGGSTLVYLNGTLLAHVPGGGGGTAQELGAPPLSPVLSWDGSDFVSGVPSDAFKGKRGTTTGAGAGGTGGGNAGSGSSGGDGATDAFIGFMLTGGGGGGGGYFGAGGGGYEGNPAFRSYGGGSGSWWFDISRCSISPNIVSSPVVFPATGSAARVVIFYW